MSELPARAAPAALPATEAAAYAAESLSAATRRAYPADWANGKGGRTLAGQHALAKYPGRGRDDPSGSISKGDFIVAGPGMSYPAHQPLPAPPTRQMTMEFKLQQKRR